MISFVLFQKPFPPSYPNASHYDTSIATVQK